MAVDFFLKIDGIEGESADGTHAKEIDLESWSWGATQSGVSAAGGGGGAGKVSMHDFQFSMRVNKASPKLMLACASGQHIKTALLTCRKAGTEQQEYMKVTMTDLLVSSFQTGGAPGDTVPIDSISINFATIKVEYAPQKADGTLDAYGTAGWDLKANKKL